MSTALRVLMESRAKWAHNNCQPLSMMQSYASDFELLRITLHLSFEPVPINGNKLNVVESEFQKA
jgi:hypothetical protein